MKNPKTDLRGSNREFKNDMDKAYKRKPARKSAGFGGFAPSPKKRPVGQPMMPQGGMPVAPNPMAQQAMMKKSKKKVSKVVQKKSRKGSKVLQKGGMDKSIAAREKKGSKKKR